MKGRNFGNLRAKRWAGDEWPEKRVSLGDADTGYAVMISPRYEEIEQAMANAEEICLAVNSYDDLYSALAETNRHLVLELGINHPLVKANRLALAKARGETE